MDLKVKTTVLIVDDEESIREILKYNLERERDIYNSFLQYIHQLPL